jgi:hypothetical protein
VCDSWPVRLPVGGSLLLVRGSVPILAINRLGCQYGISSQVRPLGPIANSSILPQELSLTEADRLREAGIARYGVLL